jgi:hypothetical protein
MKRHSSRHSILVALLVAAVILVAGGASIASNAGFKFNMEIERLPAIFIGSQGHNWVTIPYFNPYVDRYGICEACGLSAGASIFTLEAGILTNYFCSSGPGDRGPALIAGQGIRLIEPNLTVGPEHCIIVGSHDPTLQLTLPDPFVSTPPNFVFRGMPYHSTAPDRATLCPQIGLNTSSWIETFDPATGTPTKTFCGGQNIPLKLGQALRFSANNGPLTFTPAHF